MACLLGLLLGLLGQADAAATDDGAAVTPGCLDELAGFAASVDIALVRRPKPRAVSLEFFTPEIPRPTAERLDSTHFSMAGDGKCQDS